MRVLLYAPYAALPAHFETDLELAQRHLDAGDQVTVLGCHAELPACYPNWDHARSRCVGCVSRRLFGLSLLEGEVHRRWLTRLTAAERAEVDGLRVPGRDIRELKSWKIGDFDIGYGTASSLITHTRDPEPDLGRHASLARRLAQAALLTYRSVSNHLRDGAFDRVYAFNGRLADQRACLRAAQGAGVPCFIHERGQDKDHFALFPNTTPHDLEWVRGQIERRWEEPQPPDRHGGGASGGTTREEIAAAFYERRADGHPVMWHSFTAAQQAGRLPDGWDGSRHNVVVFTSSEDEFAAISDAWLGPLYEHQLGGLRRIAQSLRPHAARLHLTVRMHPNMRGLDNAQARQMRALRGDGLTVLAPESPEDSYALMSAADTVLTFGSTMGIEAVYWGKPSVLAGQCFYRGLGGTYEPKTHDELIALLTRPLEPLDRTAALKYGYYLSTRGEAFRYYDAETLTTGRFRGHRVRVHLPLRAPQAMARAIRRWRAR